jgi:hypothetical protein
MRNMLYALLILCATSAFAWDCPTGQIRQQAPAGTPTTTPYYDVVEGIAFICVPATTTPASNGTVATATNTNTNTSASNSTANSSANSSSNSSASSNQTQKQSQSQSNSSTNNNASTATGNGDNSDNSTSITNIKPASATAFAPVGFATAPCLAAFGGGAQSVPGGISFGGSRTDKGCDSRATAQQFALLLNNRVAAAKILCTTKAAKRAHLTMEDCLSSVAPVPSSVTVVAPAPVAAPVVPAPSITVNFPVYQFPQDTVAPKALPVIVKKPVAKKRVGKPCTIPPSLNSEGSSS